MAAYNSSMLSWLSNKSFLRVEAAYCASFVFGEFCKFDNMAVWSLCHYSNPVYTSPQVFHYLHCINRQWICLCSVALMNGDNVNLLCQLYCLAMCPSDSKRQIFEIESDIVLVTYIMICSRQASVVIDFELVSAITNMRNLKITESWMHLQEWAGKFATLISVPSVCKKLQRNN